MPEPSPAEFRIRFTRAHGLAALFERPANSFRWSGRARLRIDPRGMHFRATRQRMGFPWRENRFVPLPQIRDVYREGTQVRLGLRDSSRPAHLSFWANDSAIAASIVQLLPALLTVESEVATPLRPREVGRGRLHIRTMVAAVAVVSMLMAGSWFMKARLQSPEDSLAVTASDEKARLPQAGSRRRTASDAALHSDFREFGAAGTLLQDDFSTAFSALQMGDLTQQDFSAHLQQSLIPSWRAVEEKLRRTSRPPGSQHERLRVLLLAAAINWRSALEVYVEGLRIEDPRIVLYAFSYYMAKAFHAEREARGMLAPETQS